MRRRTALRLIVALLAVLATAAPASAGGWAVVHLDAEPANVVAGVPVRIGFTVLQHDVTPVDIEDFGPGAAVTLEAQHRGTAELYRATAVQDGAVGHYVVEAVFPRAGEWKWSIVPGPFAGTSFETLTVLAAPAATSPGAAANRPSQIAAGTCAARGEVVHTLANPASDPATADEEALRGTTVGSPDGLPLAISETTLDATIAELLGTPHAIAVGSGTSTVACGDIGGRMWGGELVVGLRAVGATGESGIATLSEEDGRTTVTLYLIPAGPAGTAEPAGTGSADAVEIRIVAGPEHWGFSPAEVSVAVGTTVVWTNATDVAHTVVGDDLAFGDSGPMEPGDRFRQTFDTPGVYVYRCGPHPGMVGTVSVT